MCKFGTGKRGPQGPTGPTGAPGSQISLYTNTNKSIAATTDINVILAASASGSLVFNGFINLRSAVTPVQATITPVVNGVQQTSLQIIHDLPTAIAGLCYSVIPVSGLITIVAGQTFDLNISLNNYGLSTVAVFTSVNYTIQ